MVSRSFIVKKEDLEIRFMTTFVHKLKTFMKCYTIRDFVVNEETKKFQFRTSHKIGGIRMDYPNLRKGEYEIAETDNPKEVKLTLKV